MEKFEFNTFTFKHEKRRHVGNYHRQKEDLLKELEKIAKSDKEILEIEQFKHPKGGLWFGASFVEYRD